jgi:hypothetical protein
MSLKKSFFKKRGGAYYFWKKLLGNFLMSFFLNAGARTQDLVHAKQLLTSELHPSLLPTSLKSNVQTSFMSCLCGDIFSVKRNL